MSQVPHVVIVEDDSITRELYASYLIRRGLKITEVDSLSSFRELPDNVKTSIDLILLDLNLPDGDGMTLLQETQKNGGAGVIVVTSRQDEVDRIHGLNLGADDFLVKPISPKEIYARIQAVLRRLNVKKFTSQELSTLSFKHFSIDILSRRATTKSGTEVTLTNSEFYLLQIFIEYPGQALSREFLQDKVSAYSVDVHTRLVDTLVSRLRKKLNTPEYNMIHTVYGVGYQFYSE